MYLKYLAYLLAVIALCVLATALPAIRAVSDLAGHDDPPQRIDERNAELPELPHASVQHAHGIYANDNQPVDVRKGKFFKRDESLSDPAETQAGGYNRRDNTPAPAAITPVGAGRGGYNRRAEGPEPTVLPIGLGRRGYNRRDDHDDVASVGPVGLGRGGYNRRGEQSGS